MPLKIFYTDLAAAATLSGTTAPAAGTSLANLQDSRLGTRHQVSNLTAENLDADMASAKTVECVMLTGNLTDAATATVLVDDDAAFTASNYTSGSFTAHDITYPKLVDDRPAWGRHLIHVTTGSPSDRYVRVQRTDAANPDSALISYVLKIWTAVWSPTCMTGLESPVLVTSRGSRKEHIISLDLSFGERVALESLVAGLREERVLVMPRDDVTTYEKEALYGTLGGFTAHPSLHTPGGPATELWKASFVVKAVLD